MNTNINSKDNKNNKDNADDNRNYKNDDDVSGYYDEYHSGSNSTYYNCNETRNNNDNNDNNESNNIHNKHNSVADNNNNDINEAHPLGCISIAKRREHSKSNIKNTSESTEQVKRLVLKHLSTALASFSSSSCNTNNSGCISSSGCGDKEKKDGNHAINGSGGDSITTIISSTKKENIDTEGLLSRLPYKKMLCDMFGGSIRGNLNSLPIPYVSRTYEEAFMREPMHSSERECAKGKQCECMFIDRTQPFVAVEFLLPGEQLPRTPHLCVLCCRATTQQLYYDIMIDKMDFPGTIQRFGNIHSQPDEYALDAMLIAVPSAPVHIMPLPIVSHQRNRYIVYVTGGIKRLKQSRVYFQCTPSCSVSSGM